MPRLGRPNLSIDDEDALIAEFVELWTVSGRLLTRDMLGPLFPEHVTDMGPVWAAQAKAFFSDNLVPVSAWLAGVLRRRPDLRRVQAARLEEARARAAISEALAEFFAALKTSCGRTALRQPPRCSKATSL